MRKKHSRFSEEDRISLLRAYYQSGLSKHSFCRLHSLSGLRLLNYWIEKYGDTVKSLSSPSITSTEEDMSNRSKESYREENAQLKKRIKELEKALSFSRLETEARDLMITRAEEYFNIPIRKKSGAK